MGGGRSSPGTDAHFLTAPLYIAGGRQGRKGGKRKGIENSCLTSSELMDAAAYLVAAMTDESPEWVLHLNCCLCCLGCQMMARLTIAAKGESPMDDSKSGLATFQVCPEPPGRTSRDLVGSIDAAETVISGNAALRSERTWPMYGAQARTVLREILIANSGLVQHSGPPSDPWPRSKPGQRLALIASKSRTGQRDWHREKPAEVGATGLKAG